MTFPETVARAAMLVAFAVAAVTALDLWYANEPYFRQGRPWFSTYFLGRSAVAALIGGLAVMAIYRGRDAQSEMSTGHYRNNSGAVIAGGVTALALALTVLLIVSPAAFSYLAREDALAEYASAVALLLGAAVLAFCGVRLRRSGQMGAIPAFLVAGMLFLIGMEEISWFQRLLKFSTPDWFKGLNDQHETNLHNMVTFRAEITYYLTAAVILVIVPFVALCAPRWQSLSDTRPLCRDASLSSSVP